MAAHFQWRNPHRLLEGAKMHQCWRSPDRELLVKRLHTSPKLEQTAVFRQATTQTTTLTRVGKIEALGSFRQEAEASASSLTRKNSGGKCLRFVLRCNLEHQSSRRLTTK